MRLSCSTEGVVISEENSTLLNERLKNIDLFRRALVRKRQDRLSEVVTREGRLNAVADSVKCIVSFDLENDGCVEKGTTNCDVCHALCCELHKPHETHHTFVTSHPHILLRQQIAVTAVEAESNSAVSRAQSSAASDKQPGKNTKADLCNRYKAVTGKMSVESKYSKLKVGEFRAIVEDLERAKGIFTGPAVAPAAPAANENTGRTSASTANSAQRGSARSRETPQEAIPAIQPTVPALSSDLLSNPIAQLNQLLLLIQLNPGVLDMLTTRIPSVNNIPNNVEEEDIGDEEEIL
jgi:hypothetical protein